MMSQEKGELKSKSKKKMPVWKMVCIDTTVFAISLGLFFTFDYILPQSNSKAGTVVTKLGDEANFVLPSHSSVSDEISNDSSNIVENIEQVSGADTLSHGHRKDVSNMGGRSSSSLNSRSNTNMGQIASDDSQDVNTSVAATTVLQNDQDAHAEITISKKVVGSGNDTITYYVADVYTMSVKYLQTAFASGSYGKNIKETVEKMANDNNALLAISGDFYGNTEEGVVIRNGVLYREEASGADICVLFKDGTMKTYGPDTFNVEEVIGDGAWQAWSFGPALLDGSGKILESFNTTSYINSENPRCALGYVEPGHYIFMVVDGRDEGYSRGVTLSELAQIMADEGCKEAYNLDGGKSAAMVYKGEYVNQPADGGRSISDIIYIGQE